MTGLEALAKVIPQSGKGLLPEEVEQRLAERGVTLAPGRLELILNYLLRGGMVTREGGRYLQARNVKLSAG